jgi:hypothetical protein
MACCFFRGAREGREARGGVGSGREHLPERSLSLPALAAFELSLALLRGVVVEEEMGLKAARSRRRGNGCVRVAGAGRRWKSGAARRRCRVGTADGALPFFCRVVSLDQVTEREREREREHTHTLTRSHQKPRRTPTHPAPTHERADAGPSPLLFLSKKGEHSK